MVLLEVCIVYIYAKQLLDVFLTMENGQWVMVSGTQSR